MTSIDELELSDFIGSTILVQVDVDRILEAVLMAIDSHANQLLDKVCEYHRGAVRELGLVSVPFDTIMSVKIAASRVEWLLSEKRSSAKHLDDT